MLWTAPDSWGIISSTIGKITCEKCPKSKKKLTPTIRCCSQHLMVGVIFGAIGKMEKCPKSRGEEVKFVVQLAKKNALSPEWEKRSKKN